MTNSSHCDNDVLSTYSGSANLTANWQGNPITVTWYNDDTQYDSNQCTYGGNLTMPSSIPQKTGYTFRGWRVRQAAPVTLSGLLSALNTSTNGTDVGYNNEVHNLGEQSWCFEMSNISGVDDMWGGCQTLQGSESLETCDDDDLDLYGAKWAVEFSYGIINGDAECRDYDENGNHSNQPYYDPANGIESYCWCKITSYKPNNGVLQTDNSLSWVYQGEYVPCELQPYYGQNTCKAVCGFKCADAVKNNSSFRNSIFNAQ